MAGVATSSGPRPNAQPRRPEARGPALSRCEARGGGGPAQAKAQAQAQDQVSDEFAVSTGKKVYLERNKCAIQDLFQVVLTVLPPQSMANYIPGSADSKQVWAQLNGRREHVRKAKEYIKGVCNPELHQIEYYPKDMHCIFAGARGLFLKYLIQDTCADICIESAGKIAITGYTEAVIMAKTRIQQFVQLFRDNQWLPPRRESCIKRKFKHFVESHSDKYTMDLLLLPSSVQEELMNLTQEVLNLEYINLTLGPDSENSQVVNDPFDPLHDIQTSEAKCNDLLSFEETREQAGTPVSELVEQMDTMLKQASKKSFGTEAQTSGEETSVVKERQSCKRRSSSSEDRHTKRQFSGDIDEVIAINATTKSYCNNLVSAPDVWISPSIEQQDNQVEEDSTTTTTTSEMECTLLVDFFRSMGYSINIIEKVIKNMGETEEPMELLKKIVEETKSFEKEQGNNTGQNSVPNNSSENLMNEAWTVEANNLKMMKEIPLQNQQKCERIKNCHSEDVALPNNSEDNKDEVLKPPTLRLTKVAESVQSTKPWRNDLVNERSPNENEIVARGSSEQSNLPAAHRHSAVPSYQQVKASVTGVQRFHNLLKIPYKLNLTSDPGKQNLKRIIIDGSNVAMSHGMKKVFSCRGIAIAVEFFWNRGHREITVFVPQWRTKRDDRITEQHFLNELEGLGVLSFTPARTVCGTRIASHDDRFLLHLAEETGGIIVTNDNLREFVHESASWKSIIRERLLPYTFAENIFMIPDDPLGRNGPMLDTFLQADTFRTSQSPIGQSVSLVPQPGICPPIPAWPVIPPLRSKEETEQLKQDLFKIFPDFHQREKIDRILSAHPLMRDPNALSALVLDQE